MEADLLAAIEEEYGTDLSGPVKHHVQYAKTNRSRAKQLCHKIKTHTDFTYRGSRILDVGCGHGGFVAQVAELGATAWGVEIDDKFFRYAQLNNQGEPGDIHLVHADFTSPAALEQLPTGFDLVLVNDVFEHIYDTSRLLQHLNRVLADGGLLVFAIPNGEAIESMLREGHYLKPGITLIPPNLWHHAVKWFSAYYHPWSYYEGLMTSHGFAAPTRWNGRAEKRHGSLAADLRDGFQQVRAAIEAGGFGPNTTKAMLRSLDDLTMRAEADIGRGDGDLLHWKYVVTFWEGCTRKVGPAVRDG